MKRSRYSPLKSALPFIELGFAFYFTYFLYFAIDHAQWLDANRPIHSDGERCGDSLLNDQNIVIR